MAEKLPVIVVLDNVRSAMNIGSIFRTCDAFLLEAVYLVGISAMPPNREILKTALGATETVAWEYFEKPEDCILKIRSMDAELLCIEQSDSSLFLNNYIPDTTKKCVLVFGNEVHGVSEAFIKICDACIEVPQWGMKHSLNVAVCAGIVLWEVVRKWRFEKE
jgi:tRNA G18 (ribose-2'-O)-methylase SpoU